ncbi:MAG TPA: hypothetical protein DIC64_03540 [Alphaproteobacteria bacterium]|nr:hypothetical protein [Alphaproteobacteria bacterium]
MRFLLTVLSICFAYAASAQDEVESLEIQANACEKMLEGESPSSARIRAVDKAVFLGLKSLPELKEDKKLLNDHDLNVMIYRLVDDFVEDLNSKVTKSDDERVCVQISGYINPKNIELVRKEFASKYDETNFVSEDEVAEIVSSVDADLTLKPKKIENVALLYVAPLEYYNGASSVKHASFLKDKMDNNPYYYLTEDKDLADYVVLPKLLKAKVDALDDAHKRLQMVVAVEISGLEDNPSVVSQNRFLLFSKGDNEQEIAAKLLKKLLEACAMEAMRKIEIKEQQKLEQNAIGHTF